MKFRCSVFIYVILICNLCCQLLDHAILMVPQLSDDLYALSAVLMDADSGRILYEKEGETPRPNAGTTKILTCILALENSDGDDYVQVSANAASQPQVKLGLQKGEQYYLEDLLYKKAFDQKGLIYGMGHAIYSVSDPRAEIFKQFVEQLAKEKGREEEYALYAMVERMAPQVIGEKRKIYKGVNANVDFYSGLVYSMLDLPASLYTPIFAAARVVGWSAHRLEELKNVDKIIRPAYKPLSPYREYVKMEDR